MSKKEKEKNLQDHETEKNRKIDYKDSKKSAI